MSNLGSWVSTTTAVERSTVIPASASSAPAPDRTAARHAVFALLGPARGEHLLRLLEHRAPDAAVRPRAGHPARRADQHLGTQRSGAGPPRLHHGRDRDRIPRRTPRA